MLLLVRHSHKINLPLASPRCVKGFLLSSRPPYDSEILSLYLRV